MRLNGLNAKTIHHTIYDLKKVKKINKAGQEIYVEDFVKKPKLPNIDLIVLDEGGMVGGQIAEDLLSYKIPLLVLGDLQQLPPVMAHRKFLKKPDVVLDEIMRQSKDSSIIYLSKLATHGYHIPYGNYNNGESIIIKRSELTEEHLRRADIIICGTNSTRDVINTYMRENICGIKSNRIVVGDKLICRKNYWNVFMDYDEDPIPLTNGLIGYVNGVYYGSKSKSKSVNMDIDFRPEFSEGNYFKRLPVNVTYPFLPFIKRSEINIKYVGYTVFEFGHAITCHLAQGSQYPTVLVYVESFGDSLYARQWLYTAITRAKENLILVI